MKNRKLKQAIKRAPALKWFRYSSDYMSASTIGGGLVFSADKDNSNLWRGSFTSAFGSAKKEWHFRDEQAMISQVEAEYKRLLATMLGL